jgi:hypothetical protein
VLRGGSGASVQTTVRAVARNFIGPVNRFSDIGFGLCARPHPLNTSSLITEH